MTSDLRLTILVALVSLPICRSPLAGSPSFGVNMLQSSSIAFTDTQTHESMQRLKALGADHVALVVFIEQDSPEDSEPRIGEQVTDTQLVAAIRAAHANGLETIVKPQVLVGGSWAGEISPRSTQQWFAAYGRHLEHYANIAEHEQVMALVLGTELMQLGRSKHWQPLIVKIRELYHGKLTYAAHGYQGMRRFAYWDRLDAVGLSLYPSLGQKPDAESIRKRLDHFLGYLTRDVAAPLWILEFGQPSARGSLQKPWDWRRLKHDTATPDMEVQHIALQGWLNAVRDEGVARGRIDRVTLWNWFNDPRAGGQLDNGYTVQNKPAEKMIQCLLNTGCEENRETAD